MIKKLTLLAALCLLFSAALQARQAPVIDYLIQDSILIKTPDGAQISALVVRNKAIKTPQPTVFLFTIYARATDVNKLKDAVNHGYVGVMAYTRGKKNSPDKVIPYVHEGDDANTVIDWIARQEWSNQKVGMYGGSYNGFVQWAAARHLHPALKTIVPSVSTAPGLDAPMMNNVVMSFPFPWTYYVSNNKMLDEKDYNNPQWNDLYQKWFESGKAYTALDTLIGRPGNDMFKSWLAHPTYDKFWQDLIPYKNQFAAIKIPILTTTGYYDGGQVGALYYLREHYKYNPKAEHYLIVGPYGHYGAQGKPDTVYNGYRIDPAANISISKIIYEWLDHILKGGPKPEILKDKINYQVMGTNEWRHAPSLEKMANQKLTFYLSDVPQEKDHLLTLKKPVKKGYVKQVVDFNDRTTRNSYYYQNNIVYDELFPNNGLMFKTTPFNKDTELSGAFDGELEVIINKKDMDCSVALFEQRADGSYFYLSYFMGRASYAKDIHVRNLLVPGKVEKIPFSFSYLTSKMIRKGSRLVAVVNVNKSPFEQINYGSGKPVNEETIKDAGAPLVIQWGNGSWIRMPVRE